MAAKTSTDIEKALKKIQDQVTCGICLDSYKQPKLLKCFHVYCEQCLQRLVREGAGLPCPQCRKITPLPEGGVSNLPGAFYIHYLFEIEDALKKVSSSDKAMCNKCNKEGEAVRFCCTCGFVCQSCVETHQDLDDLKDHQVIDPSTILVPSLKKALFCANHPTKKAELYCETCDELICENCIVCIHCDHQYDLVPESFSKQDKVIVDSLKPVKEQISMLDGAVKLVDGQCAAVIEQKTAVVAEIHTVMAHLQQVLEARETELVGQAEQTAQQKLKSLAAQRDRFELQLGQLKSCHNFVEESRRTCSQGEILAMKSPLVKQINELTSSFKPEILALAEEVDVRFAHSLPELVKTCQQFGKVCCHPVCPEKCRASGEGIKKVVIRGQAVTVSVEALDREGEAYLWPVESLRCELVASDGSSRVRGTVKRRNDNIYDISYQPLATGEHQLHILIEEQPICNSPFTVTALPNLTAPAKVIGDLKWPRGIAFGEERQIFVSEVGANRVTIINEDGQKKSFGGFPGMKHPYGVAIDGGGNILVADLSNYRIQKFSPAGKHLQTVGAGGRGTLQFLQPLGLAVHPHTHKVYVTEYSNHRVQVLNSDLTYCSSFGSKGSGNGEFNLPKDISTDSHGNVYVVDSDNHRIQVFTAEGVYLRQFGKKGEGEGELDQPAGIFIDPHNLVYITEIGNHCVSIFSADGHFIKSFGSKGSGPAQFAWPRGLAFDKNGALYVCDRGNHRIQVFV